MSTKVVLYGYLYWICGKFDILLNSWGNFKFLDGGGWRVVFGGGGAGRLDL